MATSTLKNENIKAIVTNIYFPNGTSLDGATGKALTYFVPDYSITAPTGYKILCHVSCWLNGQSGVVVCFDTGNLTTSQPPIYLYNVTSSARNFTQLCCIRVVTLCVPN